MTTGQMLFLVLPLMGFVLCVTVWLHMSAKRIDRMQSAAAQFEVVLETNGVTEVGSPEAVAVTDVQTKVARALVKIRSEDGQLMREGAAPQDEMPAPAPRRKTAVAARRKAGTGQAG